MSDYVPPEWGPHAIQPRRVRKGHTDEHWLSDFRYEAPREDPAFSEVYTYTDAMSYLRPRRRGQVPQLDDRRSLAAGDLP